MKSKLFILILAGILFIPFGKSQAEGTDEKSASPEAEATPETSTTPVAKPTPSKIFKDQGGVKALVVHKPKPSPAWGKVIQYHRDQAFALTDSNREITHEFLFQDDEGVIRTAIFHENASGEGYWEVWVWDQP